MAQTPPVAPDKPPAAGSRLPTATGEWWQYRGDQWLSGRSLAKGDIVTPAIRWTYPIVGQETLLGVELRPGEDALALPTETAPGSALALAWGTVGAEWQLPGPYGAAWLDLDGTGQLTAVSRGANQKIGKILPDVPGLQMVECEPKGYPKVPNVYLGTVRLKVREQGQWVTRWEVETPTLIWQSEPIFGDFDGDGRNEIALLPWYRLNTLDAATGAAKESCNYLAEDASEIPGHGGRAYGWFGAVDVDGDGQTELVIIEDFIRYATVIGRRDGQLKRLWLKVWEPLLPDGSFYSPDEQVVVRVNPEPVQDIDGDGRREIVASVYNFSRDNRWHVVALDPLSGETKYDLPGQFLIGLRDATGAGAPDLFCAATGQGPRLPEPSDLSLVSLQGGRPQTLWNLQRSAFVTYDVGGTPDTVNTGAALGGQTVLCGLVSRRRPPVFFTRRVLDPTRGEVEVTAWQADRDRRPQPVARWTGPRLEPLAVRQARRGSPTILFRTAAFTGEEATLRCVEGEAGAKVLASQQPPGPVAPVVVGRPGPGEAPMLVVQGANENLEAFRVTAGDQARRLWRVPARGMTCSNYFEGALWANLRGDGRLAVLAGTRGPDDCARLTALSPRDGRPLWHHDFPDFPGPPPPWNVPGLMYWQGGYFRDPGRMDILAQIRRVGGESYLLDGRDGTAVWRQTQGRTGRDFGRWWMAFEDFDGDGLDDILNLFPDMVCVARGTDGKLLVAEESVKYVDSYAYWSDCLVADFLGEGQPQWLYCNEFVTALFGKDLKRVWKVEHPHPGGWRNQVGVGDVNGDGRLELMFPGAAGANGREFQCREAATGALLWSLPMPDEALTFPAVADINSDGRDECVFTMGNTVWAVGSAPGNLGAGAVLWKLDLPGRAGPAAIADADGSGKAQVIVVAGDGRVYGIGSAKP